MKEYKCIYEGGSLDKFLKIKQDLEENGIVYKEKVKRKNDGWLRFFVLLFVTGTGSYGMNREHELEYKIWVKDKDYMRAAELIVRE